MNEQRMIDLETKYSLQEVMLEELLKTSHEQYLKIEKLDKELNTLIELVNSFAAGDHRIGPANQKPPHY